MAQKAARTREDTSNTKSAAPSSKTWQMGKGRWGEQLSVNAKSSRETLIVKVYEEHLFGEAEFIGQAMVPIADLTLDGSPMGFDLTLQLHTKHQPTGGATRASVAVELTFNPLS